MISLELYEMPVRFIPLQRIFDGEFTGTIDDRY